METMIPLAAVTENPANPRLRVPVTKLLEALMEQTLQRGGSPSASEIAEAIHVIAAAKELLGQEIFEAPELHVRAETIAARL